MSADVRTADPHREKREAVVAALGRGLITVTLDCGVAGVRVPAEWSSCGALVLNVSYRFRDVEVLVDEQHLGATLSFRGRAFRCLLPWASIWAMKQGYCLLLWEESMPAQAREEMRLRERQSVARGGHLRLVH